MHVHYNYTSDAAFQFQIVTKTEILGFEKKKNPENTDQKGLERRRWSNENVQVCKEIDTTYKLMSYFGRESDWPEMLGPGRYLTYTK